MYYRWRDEELGLLEGDENEEADDRVLKQILTNDQTKVKRSFDGAIELPAQACSKSTS